VIASRLGGNQKGILAIAHHAENATAGQRAEQGHALICEAMPLRARDKLSRQSTKLAQEPLKWSALRYGSLEPKEDGSYVEEETQA